MLAFCTNMFVNMGMHRENQSGSARAGRSGESVRVAAAPAPVVPVHGSPEVPPAASAMDWSDRAACLREEPELFFPIGNTGPSELLIEQATAICARCPVRSECLNFACTRGRIMGSGEGSVRMSLKR